MIQMATVTTWMEGAVMTLDANDPRLAEQEATRSHLHHMANLRGIEATHDRRTYIETVERKQGKYAADRLRADFRAEWERRNA